MQPIVCGPFSVGDVFTKQTLFFFFSAPLARVFFNVAFIIYFSLNFRKIIEITHHKAQSNDLSLSYENVSPVKVKCIYPLTKLE